MNKLKKFTNSIFIILVTISLLLSFSSCNDNVSKQSNETEQEHYIKIDGENISKSYIAYFFYLAQRNMLEEAGWKLGENGNATDEDISLYWQTTEINGKNAIDAARDLAADNAVKQKIQYFKALEEGISLSEDEKSEIQIQINTTIENNGGKSKFEKQLSEMETDMESYKQILTENVFIQKLYEKYDSEEMLSANENEYYEFSEANADKYPPENMLDAFKKYQFNNMVTGWEKNHDIEINDLKMKEFDVNTLNN